jgi:hypothetical protein
MFCLLLLAREAEKERKSESFSLNDEMKRTEGKSVQGLSACYQFLFVSHPTPLTRFTPKFMS